ncbi:hypothetical protein [Modicisalibacter radicis]|uniref:hypothetical protein n=1 Tax=Halomonas sp. EAR18 TaxID=2518972 RepID=UPI00109C2BA6|nr:hypothetical protein [Halomonas sp. EAR18]
MSRASIFDLLHQRQSVAAPVEETAAARNDYDPDRLRLVDAVALTASGFVSAGVMPDEQAPGLSSTLCDPDGFPLLVHQIGDVMPVSEPRLGRFEAKAPRLHTLVQAIVVEALMMLEALPEDTGFDVVLTAPLKSPEAVGIVAEQLRAAIVETQYASVLGEIRHTVHGDDPHSTLAVGDGSGMPHVLWISADSLLNEEDVGALDHRGVLGRSSRGAGLYPGEAVAALLVQRLLPEDLAFDDGWRIDKGIVVEHQARSSRRDHARRQAMLELLADAWPPPSTSPQGIESSVPSGIVIDAMGLPGRAVEVGSALVERWPEIDMIEEGIGVDQFCGWPGEALTALMMALAIAPLASTESALVLGLEAETRSRVWALRSCAAEAAQPGDHS